MSLDCIACTPVFRRELQKIDGIKEVKELPLLNKIIVEFDPAGINKELVRKEIESVASRSGFKDRVVFHDRGKVFQNNAKKEVKTQE